MRVAVVVFTRDDNHSLGSRIFETIGNKRLGDEVEIVDAGTDPLHTLESLSDFDGIVIVDGAEMGEPQGSVKVLDFNELAFFGSPREVRFNNLRQSDHLFYASKYLSLPPALIVAFESALNADLHLSDETLVIARCIQAIRSAIAKLTSREV